MITKTNSVDCGNGERVMLYYPRYDGNIYLRFTFSGDYAIPDDYFLQAKDKSFQWLLNEKTELKVGAQIPVVYGIFDREGNQTFTDFDGSLMYDIESFDSPIIMCTAEIEMLVY